MPKLQVLFNQNPVPHNLCEVLHLIKGLEREDEILICESEGNAEARITRDIDGGIFVEAPNNADLTFWTENSKAAYDAARTMIDLYYKAA